MRLNQSNNDKMKLTEGPNRINKRETLQDRTTSPGIDFGKLRLISIAYETVIVDLCIKCSFAKLISN